MSDETPQAQTPPAQPDRPPQKPLGHRLLLLAVIIAVVVIVYFIAAATIPRWWAHRIGDQVDGSGTAGIGLGLFYGFVFTFFALLVLSFALVRRRAWRWRAWLVAGAVVLALPNLFTLGIVLGTGNAAHAGERTLDVRAPYFRGSVLAGAIVAALAVVGIRYLMASRRRHKRREDTLRDELRSRDDADAARAAASSDEAAQ